MEAFFIEYWFGDLKSYFHSVESNYLVKKEEQSKFRLTLEKTFPDKMGKAWLSMPALQRFTERYQKRTYYRLAPLIKIQPSYFLTLTFPNHADTPLKYEEMIHRQRKSWERSTSWLRKYLPKLQMFRTFELTKNNSLHVHIMLFGIPDEMRLIQFAHYYNRNHGFLDLKKFVYYTQGSQYIVETHKYWIEDGNNHWYVVDTGTLKDSREFHQVTNYVMKYQLKETNTLHQALFTRFRIRTYSVTKELGKFIRKIVSTGEWKKVDQNFFGHDTPGEYLKITIPKPNPYFTISKGRPALWDIILQTSRRKNKLPGRKNKLPFIDPTVSAMQLLRRTMQHSGLKVKDPIREYLGDIPERYDPVLPFPLEIPEDGASRERAELRGSDDPSAGYPHSSLWCKIEKIDNCTKCIERKNRVVTIH